MSISTTLNKVIYTGNGVASEFAFTYKVFAQADLHVQKFTIADSSLDVLTLTTDYTVALTDDGESGGAVTLVAGALSSAYKLIITRVLTLNQTTDYVDNAAFSPETIETSLDKLTMICQQLKEQVDRVVLGTVDAEDGTVYIAPDYDVPEITAGDGSKLLRAKSTEDGYELKSMADVVDIDGLSAKTTVVNADVIMIEDSEDSDAKKKVATNNIISINAQTAKNTPVAADIVLIEDSAASYVKKKVTYGSLSGRQILTADGNFVAPAGITKVYLTMIGAGGGGGGGDDAPGAGGGGGGSAAWCLKAPYTVTGGSTYVCQVGAAGAAGLYNAGAPTNGGDGEDSEFDTGGTGFNVDGGKGGKAAGVGTGGLAGTGADGAPVNKTAGGYIKTDGVQGAGGGGDGGGGAGSPFGAGGDGGANAAGTAATGFGSGGGAGDEGNNGAVGGGGLIIVEW